MAQCYKSGTSSCDPRRTSPRSWACIQNVAIESPTEPNRNREMLACAFFFFLTQACCNPDWCCGFPRHRTGSKRCKVPKAPTLRERAAGPAPCSHTCRVCSAAGEQTETRTDFCMRLRTNTHDCCGRSPHTTAGGSVPPQITILCLDLKLKFKRKVHVLRLPWWKESIASSCPKRNGIVGGGVLRDRQTQIKKVPDRKRPPFK